VNLPTRIQSIGLLVAFAVIAGGVWIFQNRGERLGGKISGIKAAWLAYAIVLWFGAPLALWGTAVAFKWLAISMLIRAAIEIPLCLAGKWRVTYGITHDVLHAIVTLAFITQIPVWGTLTLISLATEIVFVSWFISATGGPRDGIFFIPAGGAFRKINRRTALIFLPQAAAFIALLASS
jgi:hypothetical protein